jgi:hypothetical protein
VDSQNGPSISGPARSLTPQGGLRPTRLQSIGTASRWRPGLVALLTFPSPGSAPPSVYFKTHFWGPIVLSWSWHVTRTDFNLFFVSSLRGWCPGGNKEGEKSQCAGGGIFFGGWEAAEQSREMVAQDIGTAVFVLAEG